MEKKTEMVEIVPYTDEWKEQFEKISAMVKSYIGDLIIKIEHVGSTSVEGLDAKPILDVDAVIENYDVFPEIVRRLEKQGYKYQGNLDVEGREVFHRMHPDGFRYNLYVCPKDGKGFLEHIAFRDYLRANDDVKKEYEALKYRLSKEFPDDIEKYAEAKTEFVRNILNKTLYHKKS